MNKKLELTDQCPMPFGTHKGVRMEKVPADYLLWLYANDRTSKQVKTYIEENLDFLNMEAGEKVQLREPLEQQKKVPNCTPKPFENESF